MLSITNTIDGNDTADRRAKFANTGLMPWLTDPLCLTLPQRKRVLLAICDWLLARYKVLCDAAEEAKRLGVCGDLYDCLTSLLEDTEGDLEFLMQELDALELLRREGGEYDD